MARATTETEYQELTVAEGRELFDTVAQRCLGISGEEFVRRWKAGEYAGPDGDRSEVVAVALLLPMALPKAR
ncbi:MAG: hypothetical protein HYY05_06555 [Chloroflexi bacterium]|nr:hypothetical protein [Chloroflexota bacterium]